jgi:hypothetical protein
VQQAFADLTYEDKANDVLETRSLAFSETDAAPKSFSVELRDPGQRRVAFEVSLMFKDGRLVQVPRSFTLAPRIFLRPDMRGHRIVSLRTERVDFASRGVKQIKVATRYEDPEHGLSIADEATFTDASESAAFEFDYVDAQKAAYEVKVTQLFANGMVKAGEWARSDEDELVVKVG